MANQTVTAVVHTPYPTFYWQFKQGAGAWADIAGYGAFINAGSIGQASKTVAINATTVNDVATMRCITGRVGDAYPPTHGAPGTCTSPEIQVLVGAMTWTVNMAPASDTIQTTP